MLQSENRVAEVGRKFSKEITISPLMLSSHVLEDVQKRKEQETLVELRKKAISRWLKKLPTEDSELHHSMWTDDNSSVMDSPQGPYDTEGSSFDVVDLNQTHELENSSVEFMKKKTAPLESDLPVKAVHSNRRLALKTRVEDIREMKFCYSGKSAGYFDKTHYISKLNFDKNEINEIETTESDNSTVVLIPSECEQTKTPQTHNSNIEDGCWSAMSECIEGSPKEDTAYDGSSFDRKFSKQNSEELFHVKYRVQNRLFVIPPKHQVIEPRTNQAIQCLSNQAKAPKGVWWLPNVCFASGNTEMTLPEEEKTEILTQDLDKQHNSEIKNLPRRLEIRLKQRKKTRSCYSMRFRLHQRCRQAQRRQQGRGKECLLEHPCRMKTMERAKEAKSIYSMAPEVQSIDYRAPASLADLSDFDCYVGPVISSLFFHGEIHQPTAQYCQNWLLDKILCFLGGQPTRR